ncbi:hypothetical protein LCGC14_0471530 [marine sediment metagenome]|uniref:Uncharacterized protein n=1 Tax=marine sediment metagenome TaxID=412755 RepID=A0A0F9UYY5_9ZZZZ
MTIDEIYHCIQDSNIGRCLIEQNLINEVLKSEFD